MKKVFAVCVILAGVAGCHSGQQAGEQGNLVATTEQVIPTPDALVRYTEDREPCADRTSMRNAYFGDLHVHTSYSFDAYGNGTRTVPEDAYNFARGLPVELAPYDEDGNPLGTAQIGQPLDFVAVTDHAEYFGEMAQCLDPASQGYDKKVCAELRVPGPESYVPIAPTIVLPTPKRNVDVCGEDGQLCEASISTLWQATQKAAEDAYDRTSQCKFTSFVGYEYSGLPLYRNQHRNIIFRNASVTDKPVSYVEAPKAEMLWEQLQNQCNLAGKNCSAIAIPHNSNLSNGSMFMPIAGETIESQRQVARLRNVTEPLMEIFQHKGNSECMNGLSGIIGEPDELCNFEQVRKIGSYSSYKNIFAEVTDCEGEPGFLGLFNGGCVGSNDFYRGANLLGLKEQQRLGVNPIKLGAVASTDTHQSTPGATDEASWKGHIVYETTLYDRLGSSYLPSNLNGNPGGLTGAWAVENSRDAIFEAFQRRETFGTSGPRIRPRFFGGQGYEPAMCASGDIASVGYANGVPMGGDLPSDIDAPTFIASALRDPGRGGAPLQKLQIIKGWIDGEGEARYQVTDLKPQGVQDSDDGYASLCAAYTDPSFDPVQPAYYYLRVVQMPTKRWSTIQCEQAGENAPERCNNNAPKIIRELAWTSPIWYTPRNLR